MIDRHHDAGRSRSALVVAAGAVSIVLAVVLGIVFGGSGGAPAHPSTTPAPTSTAAARLHAIQHLLAARSNALVHRDRAAFMATVDPRATRFRRVQARMYADLRTVPIATWSYGISAVARRPPSDAARYHAPVWAPAYFALRYRLAGFDAKPTKLQQYPTFVQRHGRWYLASLTDYAPRGLVSATDIWDYGPVKVVRRSDVLVLGAPSQLSTMTDVARKAQRAIDQVTAVWGTHWAQRAVVLVPATAREMASIDEYAGDVSKLAALTSAEVSTAAGRPAPVGDRITINPMNWPMLSEVGSEVVIRHELTHVATRAATGTQTPTWLSEGFAEYIGFREAQVSVDVAAAELKRLVDAGHVPTALPSNREFSSADAQLAAHYEAAWLACRYIADRYGQRALVRFYRAVGTSHGQSRAALLAALRGVLHTGLRQFVAQWQGYMRAELA
ncbi:MAG: hypothetical protein ACTHK4_02775 [Mycobacteriales bacterium]